MISHDHRVIFIHIPKTAGTSIESALGHQPGLTDFGGTQDHRTLRQLQGLQGGPACLTSLDNALETGRALVGLARRSGYARNRQRPDREQFRGYFKFSVVRNPWDRAFSWYRNVLWDADHRARLGVEPDISFPDFVRRCAGVDLLRPQTYWLTDFSGRIGVDQVCRFETLAADFESVCRRVGLPNQPLPHLIRGGDESYLDAYDDRTRRMVAARYRREIELFGYSFDGAFTRG